MGNIARVASTILLVIMIIAQVATGAMAQATDSPPVSASTEPETSPTVQIDDSGAVEPLEPTSPLPNENTLPTPDPSPATTSEPEPVESNDPTVQETAAPAPSETAAETSIPGLETEESPEVTEPAAEPIVGPATESSVVPATAESTDAPAPPSDQDEVDETGKNAAATPALSLSHTSGPAGVKITLTGSNFGPDLEVPVYWENPADGSTHWMGSAGTLKDGSFRMDVGVPETVLPGQYLIKAFVADNAVANVEYVVTAHAVRIDVESGERGSTIVVSGEGLLPGDEVTVKWDSIFAWPMVTYLVEPDGRFSVTIQVPDDAVAGTSTIHVQSGWLAFELPFQVTESQLTASMVISATSGQPGDRVTVTGQDFKPGQRVNIRWGGEAGLILGYKDATITGEFSGVFLVPKDAKAGLTQVVLEDGTSIVATPFTVLVAPTPTISLSPTSAKPGERVVATGTSFKPGERVNIRWGSASGPILGYKDAGSTGAVSGAIVVPQSAVAGATRIYLQAPSATVFADFTVTASPKPLATVSPASGLPGAKITVIGTNFKPGERVNIRWGSATGPILGYTIATTTGGVSGAVLVPASSSPGAASIFLQSPSATVATPFTVTAPPRAAATVSPTSALPGAKITVSGKNFRSGERVNIRWGSATGPIIGYKAASTTGAISGTVLVPTNAAAGSTRIYLQASSGTASAAFTVQSRPKANVSLSYDYGTYGDVVGIRGWNFLPGEIVTISFPSNVVVGRITVRSDGTFSGQVTVPGSAPLGYNTITARGNSSGYSAGIRFEVFETLWADVSITPRALPGAVVSFSGSGFRPGEVIYLGINGNETGLYVVSNSTGAISGSFTIPTTAAIGQHLIQFANTDFTYYAEAVVTVVPWTNPTLTLPSSASPNQFIYFSGSGFGPNERVEVYDLLTESYVGAAYTNAAGEFEGFGYAPNAYGGYTDLIAIGLGTERYAVTTIYMRWSYTRDTVRYEYLNSRPMFDQTMSA